MDKEPCLQAQKMSPLTSQFKPLKIQDKDAVDAGVISLSYEPQDNLIAMGYFDGSVRIYSPNNGKTIL